MIKFMMKSDNGIVTRSIAIIVVVLVLVVGGVAAYFATTGPADDDQDNDQDNEQYAYKIGVMPFWTPCVWFDPFTAGGKWMIEDLGHEFMVDDARWSSKEMTTVLKMWATDPELDGALIAPLGGPAVAPGYRAMVEAGQKIAFTNNTAEFEPDALFEVRFNSEDATYEQGLWIVEKLRERYGEPVRGNVVVGLGDPEDINYVQRANGFKAAFADYPNLNIVEIATGSGESDPACRELSSYLQAHPDLDVVTSVGGGELHGYAMAIEQQGMCYPLDDPRHIIVVGVDLMPIIFDDLNKGLIDRVIDQPCMDYNAIGAWYLIQYLEHGAQVLPEEGEVITYDEWQHVVGCPLEGIEFTLPSEAAFPLEVVVGSIEEFGHIWIKTSYVLVDNATRDIPYLWANISPQVDDWGW